MCGRCGEAYDEGYEAGFDAAERDRDEELRLAAVQAELEAEDENEAQVAANLASPYDEGCTGCCLYEASRTTDLAYLARQMEELAARYLRAGGTVDGVLNALVAAVAAVEA